MRTQLLLMLVAGCSAPTGSIDAERGAEVYWQPLSDGNSFACATCHALDDAGDRAARRAGHPIGAASLRGTWKNGQARTFLAAVNACVTGWQGAAAWTSSDPRFIDLTSFLDAQGDARTAGVLASVQRAPPLDLSGGDAQRGKARFNELCATCHGPDGAGSQRGPNVGGLGLSPGLVASRVRGFPLFGRMPFWAEDRLSDAELLDLVAFLNVRTARPDAGQSDAGQSDAGQSDAGRDAGLPNADAGVACGASHAKVGWTGTFSTIAHDVRGRVTATSDCTLEVTNFEYDGNGIDVRFYGAPSTATFGSGIALGPQLYRPGVPWQQETLVLTLPAGKTLDDVSALSVWCVAVGVSFGHTTLQPP